MIRRYVRGDAGKIVVQQAQVDEFDEAAVAAFDSVGAFTLAGDNGEVLAVFGYWVYEDLSADCYALVSQNAGKYLREALCFLQREIVAVSKQRCLRCVRMTVKKGFDAGVRFARLLGFEFVAELPRFYLENDYQLFERI